MLSKRVIVNLFFILSCVLCEERRFCDLSDSDCITPVYKVLLKKVIEGSAAYNIGGADPLHRDEIRVIQPYMNLTLNNSNMYGTGACEGRILKYDDDKKWHLSFWCPKLTLKSDYEINGEVDSAHIEGKGRCEIVYNSYDIGLYGGYDKVTGEDGKPHFRPSFYKMELTNVNENVVYKFDNLFNGDKEKSDNVHKYINSNWKKLHDIIGEPIMNSMMGHFINNVKKFLKHIPMYELFDTSLLTKSQA